MQNLHFGLNGTPPLVLHLKMIVIACLCGLAAAQLSGLATSSGSSDSHQITASLGEPPSLEIVIFVEPNCAACQAMQMRVRQGLGRLRSVTGTPLQLQLIDKSRIGTGGYALAAPLVHAPVLVIVRDGVERARHVGVITAREFARLVERHAVDSDTG